MWIVEKIRNFLSGFKQQRPVPGSRRRPRPTELTEDLEAIEPMIKRRRMDPSASHSEQDDDIICLDDGDDVQCIGNYQTNSAARGASPETAAMNRFYTKNRPFSWKWPDANTYGRPCWRYKPEAHSEPRPRPPTKTPFFPLPTKLSTASTTSNRVPRDEEETTICDPLQLEKRSKCSPSCEMSFQPRKEVTIAPVQFKRSHLSNSATVAGTSSDPLTLSRKRLSDRLSGAAGRSLPLKSSQPKSPLLQKVVMKANSSHKSRGSLCSRGSQKWTDPPSWRSWSLAAYKKLFKEFGDKERRSISSVAETPQPIAHFHKTAGVASPVISFPRISQTSPCARTRFQEEDDDIRIIGVVQTPRKVDSNFLNPALSPRKRATKEPISEFQRRIQSMKEMQDGFLDNEMTLRAEGRRRRKEMLEATEKRVSVIQENERLLNFSLEEKLRETLRIREEVPLVDDEIFLVPETEEEVEEKLAELTVDMLEQADEALYGRGNPDEVLVEAFNIPIKKKDLQTLRDGAWLNDEVINFFFNMIQERSSQGGEQKENVQNGCPLPSVYVTNTFFYTTLKNKGYGLVRRWTKKVDIFAKDFVLIPVHLGMHWTLAVLDMQKKVIRYYDSLLSDNSTCLNLLLDYLEQELKDKKKEVLDKAQWVMESPKDIPAQQNGYDCGMFTCRFAETLSRRGKIIFNQEDMPYFRKRTVYEILKKTILKDSP
ncbi:unnamed protein product [Cyprideis torosa]|uniref:Uncharacterized protein n=1 Tax=Cyprideis torosa TaxID=163714 RepID=A0A7R8ZMM5_9CRUS|nr:unnamed protein product [Cyprideis torosa]CAG0889235.1 unnamed protein product [Cyprideis torosa]